MSIECYEGRFFKRIITHSIFQLLYMKPLVSLLSMYHLLPEFRSAFLRIIRLEYKLEAPARLSGHQYERMYIEIDETISPGTTL